MSQPTNKAELADRLWKEVDAARFGMLGLVGGTPHHMQPMACYADPDENAVWFYTKRGTDLARDTGSSHAAMFCVMSKDQQFQACIGGDLTPDHDRAKIDQFWSANVDAWFPGGKTDPELTLLKLSPVDAEVWVSRGGAVKYMFEVAKANATHTLPDVSETAKLDLA